MQHRSRGALLALGAVLLAAVPALGACSSGPDDRFAAWAKVIGVALGHLPADEKDDMVNELDAVVGHLYGLTETHLVHIFETFHEGWDYAARLRATLKHFREWKRRNG